MAFSLTPDQRTQIDTLLDHTDKLRHSILSKSNMTIEKLEKLDLTVEMKFAFRKCFGFYLGGLNLIQECFEQVKMKKPIDELDANRVGRLLTGCCDCAHILEEYDLMLKFAKYLLQMEPFNKQVVRLVREAFLSRKYNKNVRVYCDDKDKTKEVLSFEPDKDTKTYPEKNKQIIELTIDQRSQIDQITQEANKFFDMYLKKKSKENASHFLESALNSYTMANDLMKFERIDCVYACFEKDSGKVVKEDFVRYVVICYNIWICYLELNEFEIGFTYLNRCLECFAKIENDENLENELNSSENNSKSQSDLESAVKIQKTQKLLKHYKIQANESVVTFLKHLQTVNFLKEELDENTGEKLSRQQRRQIEKKQAKEDLKSEKNKDAQIEELKKKNGGHGIAGG